MVNLTEQAGRAAFALSHSGIVLRVKAVAPRAFLGRNRGVGEGRSNIVQARGVFPFLEMRIKEQNDLAAQAQFFPALAKQSLRQTSSSLQGVGHPLLFPFYIDDALGRRRDPIEGKRDRNSSARLVDAQLAYSRLQRMKLGSTYISPTAQASFETLQGKLHTRARIQRGMQATILNDIERIKEGNTGVIDTVLVKVSKNAEALRKAQEGLKMQMILTRMRFYPSRLKIGRETVSKHLDNYATGLQLQGNVELPIQSRRESITQEKISHSLQTILANYKNKGMTQKELVHIQELLGVKERKNGKLSLLPFSKLGTLMLLEDTIRAAGESMDKSLIHSSTAEAAVDSLKLKRTAQFQIAQVFESVDAALFARSASQQAVMA